MHPPVKTFFRLEMNSPSELRGKPSPSHEIAVRRIGRPAPEFSWFFHEAIGSRYNWGGREKWSMNDWRRFVGRDSLETWVAYWSDAPVGYFEIERQFDDSQRILCFGLLEDYIGRGLGGYLLTFCVQRCWQLEASRIWLRTCTYDHPHALANYKARGFTLAETTSADRPPTIRTPRIPE